MTEKQAIRKSIEHWKRMIRYVSRNIKNKKTEPDAQFLYDHLKETYNSKACALCVLCNIAVRWRDACKQCPLGKKFGSCISSDEIKVKNAYIKVEQAVTWKGWLYYGRRLLKQLKSLE